MIYTVTYGGEELTNFLRVKDGFTPFIGANWAPSVKNFDGIANGGEFQYQKFSPKTISMPFVMLKGIGEKYDALQKILSTKELKRLIFFDQPDRYYMAVPSENLDFEQILETGQGTITWIIPDGVAHGREEKVFNAYVSPDTGNLTADIYNAGTGYAPISYKLKMNHDNGFIGIVSEHGAIQLGKIQEVDGVDYQQNEILIDGIQLIQNASDDHGENYMHPDHVMTGTLSYAQNSGGIVIGSMGTGQSGRWCGGMRTITLPADSEGHVGAKNFWCYMNWWFQTAYLGQTGEQSIAFLTADNKVICGYSLYKADMSGNTADLEFWMNGKIVDHRYFTPSGNQNENPFDEARGNQDIRKEGDTITFYWFGTYYPFSDPAIKDMECAKIQVAFTQYYGRNIDPNGQYVTRNCLRNLIFQKMFVDKWKDVPNRYSAGDLITIDGEDTKVYRNGMNVTVEDEIVGSYYFQAPPGKTKVEFRFSDFCDPLPDVVASIREVYL